MHVIKALILSCLMVLATSVFADSSTPWPQQAQAAEKEALTDWVVANAHSSVTRHTAADIVTAVSTYAQAADVDVTLALAVAQIESRFVASAQSKDGSKGLFQVLYRIHHQKFKGRSALSANASADVGIQILQACQIRAKGSLRGTLVCYVGAPNAHYYQTIQRSRMQLAKAVREKTLDRLFHFVNPPTERLTYAGASSHL